MTPNETVKPQTAAHPPRIDAHHHLWRYSAEEYGWIDDSMGALRRDFLPDDLKPVLDAAGIDGAVAVQARQTLEETEWLLALAAEHDWMRGVVGWAPLAGAEFPAMLERLAEAPKLKGLRHVVQAEPVGFLLGAEFNRGIRALRQCGAGEHGLVYDILIYARQLREATAFVDMHPEQLFVVDHCAKPAIAGDGLEPWASAMRELARRPHVACKISGLVTEADWQRWTPERLTPYWEVVLEAFGPERLLFGSDWPVALVASAYRRWAETVAAWTASLSASEQAAIWGGTAARIYRL